MGFNKRSGNKWFGPITPLGGMFFIIGWVLLVIGLIKGVIGPNHLIPLIPSAYKLPLNNTVPVTKQNATRLAHVDETTPDSTGKSSKANA